jgi:hypothetical protein
MNNPLKEKIGDIRNSEINEEFAPYHPDEDTSQWIAVSDCDLPGIPCGQRAEADGESRSNARHL